MLLACLARSVIIVTDQEQLGALNGSQDNYLGANVVFDLPGPVSLTDLYFDCAGNQITAYSQLFSALSNAMLRNCVFMLEKQFAATVEESTLTNVTILATKPLQSQTSITNSELYGVRIEATSQFFANATESRFFGCAFSIFVQETNESQAFIGNLTNCTVQNCYLSANIAVSSHVSAAGLAINASEVALLKSRFIANITAQVVIGTENGSALLSGCIANETKNLTIKDCDFLTTMRVAGNFIAAAGVLAAATQNKNLSFHNLSSYFAFADGVGCVCSNIGNVIGALKADTAELSAISTFNNVQIKYASNQSTSSQDMIVSGMIAQTQAVYMRVSNSFAFGSFQLDVGKDFGLIAAGCIIGGAYQSFKDVSIDKLHFIGNIDVLIPQRTGNLNVGGLLAQVKNCVLNHSSFCGNISATKNSIGNLDIAMIAAFGLNNVTIDACFAAINLSIVIQDASQTFISGLGSNVQSIKNSLVTCDLSIAQTEGSDCRLVVGMLAAQLITEIVNCSAVGNIVFKTTNAFPMNGYIGGAVGSSELFAQYINLTVRGRITAPEGTNKICTVVSYSMGITLTNIVVALDVVMKNASAKFHNQNKPAPIATNLLIDCSRAGNDAKQEYCKADLTNGDAVAELGGAFSWNSTYNDGYPYLNMLPVLDASKKYVLPESGGFSADSYFVDDAGFPFPKVDFQPCRGVCYGVYSSPVIRTCDDAFEYCIDVDRAAREFPGGSCIANNAVCSSGASFCSSEAEMLLLADTSEYACQKACPGCQNGRCSQSKCVCDIYSAGDTCSPKCDADQPICFSDESQMCNKNNTACTALISCDDIVCVHGGCVDLPTAHCECKNHWEGDDCGICKDGFDPASDCTQCKAAMEVIDGNCACGHASIVCEDGYFCKSGSCQKNCMLLDKNCTNCDQSQLDLCGSCQEGLVLSKGVCMAPKGGSAAAIVGGVVGGCVAIAAVGLAVFFALKQRKNGTNSSKAQTKIQASKDHGLKLQIAADDSNQPLNAKQKIYTENLNPKSVPNEAEGP